MFPIRMTKHSAGYDIATPIDVEINPRDKVVIATDIKAYMQEDEALFIYLRSSMGIKKSLRLSNGVGIVDMDYYNNVDNEGNIHIAITNDSDETIIIEKGERIAQGVFKKFLISDNCNSDNERIGGIGSSNK